MPVDFEIRVTDLFGHELESGLLHVPITYSMTTPEREKLQDDYRDLAISMAKAAMEDESYGTDHLRAVVWGKKTRHSNGQVTSWRAYEIFRRGTDISSDWLDECDYLNIGVRKSGKR